MALTDVQKAARLAKKLVTEARKLAEQKQGKLIDSIWRKDPKRVQRFNNNRKCATCHADGECLIGPYSKLQGKCNGERHHVVFDQVHRYGVRSSSMRISNATSINDGICICISDKAHKKLHIDYDKVLEELPNDDSAPSGTAPFYSDDEKAPTIFKTMEASIDAIEEDPPDAACRLKAKNAARSQMLKSKMGDKHGRTTRNPPEEDSDAYNFLKAQ